MTCPRCGGCILRDNDLTERHVCLNCGYEPNVLVRAALGEPDLDHGRPKFMRRARMYGDTRRRVTW
jgi:hypothetical protein